MLFLRSNDIVLSGESMKKKKRKVWNDKRSIKYRDKWYRKEKRSCGHSKIKLEQGEVLTNKKEFIATIPEIFSFVKNLDETAFFLDRLIKRIEKKIFKQAFYIDAKNVEEVTVEALIYIIAIIYNIKANRMLQYKFTGNLPMNKNARTVFEKSGYLNYFKIKRLQMPDSSEYVQIVSGKKVENDTAGKICDFVNEKLSRGRLFTKILYATLIELMSNTAKHAYNNQNGMIPCWYLYASYENGRVDIAFVDTGEGIPNTVKKKLSERLKFKVEDSKLIYAALTEKGRSETGLSYRGRGLPNIYKHVCQKELKEFVVLSGSGCCRFDNDNDKVVYNENQRTIFGTIFKFSIMEVCE